MLNDLLTRHQDAGPATNGAIVRLRDVDWRTGPGQINTEAAQ
ncbi:hypothetical protein [Pararhodobacter sp.]